MSKVFVVADTHFGHSNIINYCNRPFADVEAMNKELVKKWNSTVGKCDKVFVLGDFAFGKETIVKYAKLLNGRKFLVKGNHDSYSNDFYRNHGFEEVSSYPILVKDFFLLSHAPLQLSETTPYFNIYGHVHNDEKYVDNKTSKCVSVERTDYKPLLLFDDEGNINLQ